MDISIYVNDIIQEMDDIVRHSKPISQKLIDLITKYVYEILKKKGLSEEHFNSWFYGILCEFTAIIEFRKRLLDRNITNIRLEDPKCEVLRKNQGDSGDIKFLLLRSDQTFIINCKSKTLQNAEAFKDDIWWHVKKDNKSDYYIFCLPNKHNYYCGFKHADELEEYTYLSDLNDDIDLFLMELQNRDLKFTDVLDQFNKRSPWIKKMV